MPYARHRFCVLNLTDLGMINDTYQKMKGKPVIVSVNMNNPMVFAEFEKNAPAILVHFGVQDQALLDLLTGASEPSAITNARQYGNGRKTI